MRRWVLVALVSTLALVMLAVFSLMAPPPARPVKPTELEPEIARERARPAHFDEPVRPAEPPPAPEVANDPARGEVWLRVIDFDTNMPLALRRCELCEIETTPGDKPVSEFFWREAVTLSSEARDFAETDAQGLLSFKVVTDKFTFFGRVRYGDKLEWKYPLPPAFEPVTHPDAVAAAIAALKTAPQPRPIDVQVRPAPRVQGRVWDPEGRPAAGAEVFAWPVEVAPELDALARCVSEHYEWLRASPAGYDVFVDAETKLKLLDEDGVADGEPPASGEERQLSRRFGIGNLAGHFRANTDRNGRYTLPPLLRGSWMICARSETSATATRRCHLARLDNEVEFSLPTRALPVLRVSVDFKSAKADSLDILVWAERCTPAGEIIQGRDGARDSCPVDTESMVVEFGNLAPGYYAVGVQASIRQGRDGTWSGGALVQLESGVSRNTTVALGPALMGLWQPTVTIDGKPMKALRAMLQGGPYVQPTEVGVETSVDRRHATAGLPLPAGTYRARMPGVSSQEFTVVAGRDPSRTDWDFRAAKASFLVEKEFAVRALAGARQATLALWPQGELAWIASRTLAEVNNLQDLESIELDTEGPLVLSLFPGEYKWTLEASEKSFCGTLTVDDAGNVFRFGLDHLPGLYRLEIDLTALVNPGGEAPALTVRRRSVSTQRIAAQPRGFAARVPPREERSIPDLVNLGQGRFAAFAEPGLYEVSAGQLSATAGVPGRVVLAADASGTLVKITLSGPRAKGTRLEARVLDSDGLPHVLYPGTTIHVKPGGLSVSGYKEVFAGAKNSEGQFCTGGHVDVSSDAMLDLHDWTWTPYGNFTLTCRGQQAPGLPTSPWWSSTDGWRNVRIVCVTRADVMGPAEVDLFDVDDWMPQGHAEFIFRNRSVPPGRYKAIPWPGATEKYCEVFEVEGGKHTSVELDFG